MRNRKVPEKLVQVAQVPFVRKKFRGSAKEYRFFGTTEQVAQVAQVFRELFCLS
jgi:hypothetical protein